MTRLHPQLGSLALSIGCLALIGGSAPPGAVGRVIAATSESFVLHCHILDHEDLGMMQNVRIAIPDGRGGVTMSHN